MNYNITNILGSIDKKIEINKKKIAKLEAIAREIYNYWFVQYEFPDENGKPYKSNGGQLVWNEELKREIPNSWTCKHLGQVFDITMGTSPIGNSINEDKHGIAFFQGAADFGVCFPTVRTYTISPIRFAEYGDILLSVRAPVGAINIANIKCCIGRGLCSIHTNYRSFTLYALKSMCAKFNRVNAAGTTFGALTKDELLSIPIAFPSHYIIDKYDKVTVELEEKIITAAEEIKQLQHLKEQVLPLLMNGQVTVL